MRNIFAQTKDYVDPPKRNVFDLSHSNHSTFQFGYLYPVLNLPVIPGDSVDIDPTFALRFLPTAFPVQTKITANLHFFYVRNRNLWDKWTKFIGHTHDTEFPYLDGSQDCIKTGGLADYLGIPTTIIGGETNTRSVILLDGLKASNVGFVPFVFSSNYPFSANQVLTSGDLSNQGDFYSGTSSNLPTDKSYAIVFPVNYNGKFTGNVKLLRMSVSDYGDTTYLILGVPSPDGLSMIPKVLVEGDIISAGTDVDEFKFFPSGSSTSYDVYFASNPSVPRSFNSLNDLLNAVNLELGGTFRIAFATNGNSWIGKPWIGHSTTVVSFSTTSVSDFLDIADIPSNKNPFVSGNVGSIRLNALPFRAYESIYNAFYRNEQNDPLMINGDPEYDKYLPNDGSGADSFPYQLYKRNWELDFLSSAVQSPQQGIAPLVGVSSSGDFTFVHKDDNGNIGYFSAKAQISADGKSISGVQLSDTVELDGLPTTPIVADIPEPVKRGSVYTLNQMALAGISINDFRNVNSLQRWLETNIRRGFKYRDQIKSHFGIDVDFDVLDMPEFIGGISEPVYSSQVNQTSESENDPLGSYAGQLSLIASSKHSIRHYCHEHGYIIGIFSVIPVPNYSQLLPKDFIKSNYLDFYFPEFSHIGMQPVDYREVCPLQAYGVSPDNLLKTFGYQRPWYDYIANVDSVHGLFRTNLRNFVLNRQFDTLPMLNKDFLQVDPSQLNDIFTVDDVSDKILGQIHFNITAKRPIPRFGIPRLE